MNLEGAKRALFLLVQQMTQKYDYFAPRAAKVIAQNDDYTLELKPEDEAWPGMSKVPLRLGLPGFEVKIKPGARVLFTFEDGDSTRPVVTSWDKAAVEKIIVDAAMVDLRNGKGRSIAANGDTVIIPSTKPIPVLLFSDQIGTVPAVLTSPAGPVPVHTTGPLYLRFAGPGFMAVGQVVAVSPNKS